MRKVYLIRKGFHRSMLWWKPLFKPTLSFSFVLDHTCMYVSKDERNQEAVNKLYGFSDGTFNHHKNSFRIGWNYDPQKDRFRIFAYSYIDRERKIAFLGYAKRDQKNSVNIKCMKGKYQVVFNNKIKYLKRSEFLFSNYKHLLYPYFGGVEVAPHHMRIEILD